MDRSSTFNKETTEKSIFESWSSADTIIQMSAASKKGVIQKSIEQSNLKSGHNMIIVGKTQDGIIVVAGLGKLYFQEGIPLSIIFDGLKSKNILPSFKHLYSELRENGMKHERIIHLLNENVFESYGKQFRDVVISKLTNPSHETTTPIPPNTG